MPVSFKAIVDSGNAVEISQGAMKNFVIDERPVPPSVYPTRVIHRGRTVRVPKPIVLVDTREPEGFAYTFRRFGKWFAGVERTKLATGDYSIKGLESELAIERKSLPDLVGSLIASRARFLRECERLSLLNRKAIVVEASLAQAKFPYEKSQVHPNVIVGTLYAIQERWDIQVVWADSPELAEEVVAHILSKYHILRWLKSRRLPRRFVDGAVAQQLVKNKIEKESSP